MRWFTSDHHVGHGRIVEMCNRPFWKTVTIDGASAFGVVETEVPDVDAMSQALLANYNKVVHDDDEVYFVGDVAMGVRRDTVPFFSQFKGRKFLVPGNHDNVHRMFPKWAKAVPLYESAGFEILDAQIRLEIAGQEVLVCHFPYSGDSHHDDRYSAQRPDDDGSTWVIHGHTHAPEQVNRSRRQIHVGVDAWGMRPVPESTIAEIITGG